MTSKVSNALYLLAIMLPFGLGLYHNNTPITFVDERPPHQMVSMATTPAASSQSPAPHVHKNLPQEAMIAQCETLEIYTTAKVARNTPP